MTRRDLISFEAWLAETYRREAAARSKYPALAGQLLEWAKASERRVETMRCGPLFHGGTMTSQYVFDAKCLELAEHFLSDCRNATPTDCRDLAVAFQSVAEDFCDQFEAVSND